jgi:hypothetical protein
VIERVSVQSFLHCLDLLRWRLTQSRTIRLPSAPLILPGRPDFRMVPHSLSRSDWTLIGQRVLVIRSAVRPQYGPSKCSVTALCTGLLTQSTRALRKDLTNFYGGKTSNDGGKTLKGNQRWTGAMRQVEVSSHRCADCQATEESQWKTAMPVAKVVAAEGRAQHLRRFNLSGNSDEVIPSPSHLCRSTTEKPAAPIASPR